MLEAVWLGPVGYEASSRAHLVLACHKLPVQWAGHWEVDSAVSSTLIDHVFSWFCMVAHHWLWLTALWKLYSRIVNQNHKWSPWCFKLIWDVGEGATLLLRQPAPFPFKPFLSLSPQSTAWEMGVDIMASWSCHDLHGITPAHSYLQAFENMCPSCKVMNRPSCYWKDLKLPGLFWHKPGLS